MIIEYYERTAWKLVEKHGKGINDRDKSRIVRIGMGIFGFLYSVFKFMFLAWLLNKVYTIKGYSGLLIVSFTMIIFYTMRKAK